MTTAAELHRKMFTAVSDRDLTALRELYHPDYIYMAGDGVEHKGADAGIEVAETYTTAFPDLTFTFQHQWEVGPDVSIIELRVTGTHQAELDGIPATGKRVELALCNVVEVRDGRIVREREYYDGAAMLQQLGVME